MRIINRIEHSEEAFAEVVDIYFSKLYSTAFYITKDKPVAEDLVQDAFMKLWQKRAEVVPDNLGGWLYKVVAHSSYKHLRRESKKAEALNFLKAGRQEIYCEVEDRLIQKEHKKVFDEAYARLPQKQQEVYRLSKEEGFKREEIAKHLNISSHTVRNHLVKAIQFIKEHVATLCLVLFFFVFNNLFLSKSSTNFKFRDLYRVNRTIDKNLPGERVNNFPNSSSISLIKIPSATNWLKAM